MVVLILSGVAALFVWQRRISRLGGVRAEVRRGGGGGWAAFAFFGVLGIMLAVLLTLSASDVRTDGGYLFLYTVMGLAVAGQAFGLHLIGWTEADVAQRGNVGAGLLLVAVCAGQAFAFAGANIGDGPGFEVVLGAAAVSMGTLWVFIVACIAAVRANYRVLVERDNSFAFRWSWAIVAVGAIAGRSVAGTWHGAPAMFSDYAHWVWPAGIILASEIALGWIVPPQHGNRLRMIDCTAALLYQAGAVAYIVALGIPT